MSSNQVITLILSYFILSIIFIVFIICFVSGYYNKTINNKHSIKPEVFTSFFRSPDACPALLDSIRDPLAYEILSNRVKTLVNNDGSFLGFKNNKTYDHNENYCYISPNDDEVLSHMTEIPCEKSHPLYDFPMIESVDQGVIMIDEKASRKEQKIPRQKDICIMKINTDQVNTEDVNQFNNIISRHEDAYTMRSLEDYRKTLTDRQQDFNRLRDTNAMLSKNLEAVRNQYNRSVTQRIKALRQNIFTQAENDALKYSVIILGIDQYINYDNTTRIPRLSINLLDGATSVYDDVSLRANNLTPRSIDVPKDFTISHIFLPPRASVKLIKEDRTFVTFLHSTDKYPRTDAIDTKNTVKIEALVL